MRLRPLWRGRAPARTVCHGRVHGERPPGATWSGPCCATGSTSYAATTGTSRSGSTRRTGSSSTTCPVCGDALSHLDRRPSPGLRPSVDRLVAEGWVVEGARTDDPSAARGPLAVSADATCRRPRRPACARRPASPAPRDGRSAARRHRRRAASPRVSDALVRDDVAPPLARRAPPRGPARALRGAGTHAVPALPRRPPRRRRPASRDGAPPARGAARSRRCTDPDPCLVQLGVAWAVRDLVRVLDGSRNPRSARRR